MYVPDQPPSVGIFLDEFDNCSTHKTDFIVTRCLVCRQADVSCTNCGIEIQRLYSGTSDKRPSEIGTTSLQRTLVAAPC